MLNLLSPRSTPRLLGTAVLAAGVIASPFTFATTDTAAAGPALDRIKAAVQKNLGDRATVKGVAATPIAGLYEVNLGKQIVYADASGRYLLVGELQDMQTGDNLTENRSAEINRIRWADLPLNQAIVWKRGDGSRKLAVFSDPNCGYCKRLEQTLQTLNNLTVYTFLMPILSADSSTKAQQIWCSADRSKAYLDWMLKGEAPMGQSGCSHPLERNIALAQGFGVQGTPAIFFTDGSRMPGAASAQVLERKLAAAK